MDRRMLAEIDNVVDVLSRHFAAADRRDLVTASGDPAARALANDLAAALDLLEGIRFDLEDDVAEDADTTQCGPRGPAADPARSVEA